MVIVSKNLNILDYAISLLLRNRLKNCGIFIVFSAVIFLLSSFQLVTSALNEIADRVLTTVPDITVQQMTAGRQTGLPREAKEKLNGIFGIAAVKERIWGYYFDEKNGANYTVIGLDPARIDPSLKTSLVGGSLPVQKGEVVLATPVAESMQLGKRKSFSLFRPDLTLTSFSIVNRFKKNTALVTDDVILMSLVDARDLFAIAEGDITDLLVEVANPGEIDTIARKISENLPGSRVITRKQIKKTYDVVFGWRSGFGSVCLLTSLFAFIILAWDKASGLSPEEKKEMAILKITGWQTADIMTLRFWQSSVVCFFSLLVGYSLAWLHVCVTDAILFRPILLGWSVLQPSYTFDPPFLFSDFLLIFSCSVVPYLAATVVPAWKSAMVRPETVI